MDNLTSLGGDFLPCPGLNRKWVEAVSNLRLWLFFVWVELDEPRRTCTDQLFPRPPSECHIARSPVGPSILTSKWYNQNYIRHIRHERSMLELRRSVARAPQTLGLKSRTTSMTAHFPPTDALTVVESTPLKWKTLLAEATLCHTFFHRNLTGTPIRGSQGVEGSGPGHVEAFGVSITRNCTPPPTQ